MRYVIFLALSFLLIPVAATAQDEDDRGFLTRTIEGALSGAGREVRIDGFTGALSSEASFDSMQISDAEGVWLTLEDVVLVWSRTALLRGRLEVNRLSAARLDIARLPETEEVEELPSAEASGFSLELPDLPVSINIAAFEVAQIDLGEPLLGVPVQLSVAASARLDDDGLDLDMTAERTDDVTGVLALTANVIRDGSEITLDMALTEEPGGIAARLLNLPDQPSVDLKIAGAGPLSDFATDIALSTDGAPRLAGQISLDAEDSTAEGDVPDRRIQAQLGGDITSLIAPDYQDFFGSDVGLTVNTLLRASGEIDVQSFELAAEAVQLAGRVRLNADLWPEFIDVAGEISQDGAAVVLPGSDAGITVQSVLLDVDFDASADDAVQGTFDITDFVQDAVQIDRAVLSLDGQLQGGQGSVGQFLADLALTAEGITLADATAGRALGRQITGQANINYIEGQPIRISDLAVTGPDYGLEGQVIVRGLENGFPTRLNLSVAAQDLARFAELAGQPIAGSAQLSVSGMVTPLAGTFDLAVSGNTQDLSVGIAEADAVLAGLTVLSVAAERNETGTFVRGLELRNDALEVAADAELRTLGSDVSARVRLADVALVLPQYEGSVEVDATAQQTSEGWVVQARADAPYNSSLSIDGLATGPDADVRFDLAVPQVARFVPDIDGALAAQGRVQQSPDGYVVDVRADGPYDARVEVAGLATGPDADMQFSASLPEVQPLVPSVRGPLSAAGRIWQSPDGYRVDVTADGPYEAKVAVEGLATGPNARVMLEASMPDIGVFVPQIDGPLRIDGEVAKAGERWQVDTDVGGPAGTTAIVSGTVAGDGSETDLTVTGQAPLGLSAPFLAPRNLQGQANFDLALRGPPGLNAVSGRITTSGATFTAPELRLGLNDLSTTVALSNGSAQITSDAAIAAGGRVAVSGGINLSSLVANLAIELRNAVFTDPRIYAATINGGIEVDGPLTGGARIAGTLNLAEVNVSVPASGITSIGAIPDIRHIGSRRGANATRARAGLGSNDGQADARAARGPGYPLAITVNAPSRIFVRGRGLNAELGGSLRLTGNTNNIISAGSFDLVRGRLDIIGKRFELDEGSIQFQGSVTPFVRFVTTTEIPDGTASIVVEGLASEPEISFTSNPEAPEDEVLSLIIFGRYVSQLSAFQALELVNGLAELSGRKGVGLLGNIREGLGVDELDVTTTESGDTAVTAGKYISEDIYTDVTTSGESGTDLSLNIDLTDDLTAKATVGSEGDSSIGLFFERDY